MKYTIETPKNHSELFCLYSVADAMAKAKATDFGTLKFHQGTYGDVFRSDGEMLIKEVMNGHLQVFDASGATLTANDIEAAKSGGAFHCVFEYIVEPDYEKLKTQYPDREVASGCWNWAGIDLGKTRPNEFLSSLHYLHTSLQSLNDWGKTTGKQFELNEYPVDMREFGPKNERGEFAFRGFAGRGMMARTESIDGEQAEVEVQRSITKQAVINAFDGIHFTRDRWNKNLGDIASAPWLRDCQVSKGIKGDKSNPSTWNPVLIASALSSKRISTNSLNSVFQTKLKDWLDEWTEASATFRD